MGSRCSSPLTEDQKMQLKRSKDLKKYIERSNREFSLEIKLLLLGTADSGKTTFTRQISVIHGNGLNDDRERFIEVCRDNALVSMQIFMGYCMENGIALPEKIEKMAVVVNEAEYLEEEVAKNINKIGTNKRIIQIYKEVEFDLNIPSGALYYWENVKRYAKTDFSPINEDIIRSKLVTNGINEIKFVTDNIQFNLVDVGGQRSERSKWINSFDSVKSVIFLCAISEYEGKRLEEDTSVCRLIESINLYQRLSRSQWLTHIPFIIFLNKSDLFEEKLQYSPLANHEEIFANYKEFEVRKLEENPENTLYEIGLMFFELLFRTKYRGSRSVHVFPTCAIDEEQCRHVFEAVQEQVITKRLRDAGI